MGDLSDIEWIEYLEKEDKDILWKVYFNLCAVKAMLTITNQQDLHDECGALATKVEERLK